MAVKRKRQPEHEAEPTNKLTPPDSQPIKRPKLEQHSSHSDAASFWDILSRVWLTSRALREFDRRTELQATPTSNDPHCKPHVDAAQLKRFARRGGPDLSDLRGYTPPRCLDSSGIKMTSKKSKSQKRSRAEEEDKTSSKRSKLTSSTKKTSAYDSNFEQVLEEFGVFPEGRSEIKPKNFECIKSRLARRRPSLSSSQFSDKDFAEFEKANRKALSEDTVTATVLPRIATTTTKFESQCSITFNNLKDLAHKSLVKAQPDMYDGCDRLEVDEKVRSALDSYINPSTKPDAPWLPNLFGEWKGPEGSERVCKRQALYDGALGARATATLRSYTGPDISDEEDAYTLSILYHPSPGYLFIFAHHCTRPTGSNRDYDYHMHRLGGWLMCNTSESFREGATAFRNARYWAKEQRDHLIALANSRQ